MATLDKRITLMEKSACSGVQSVCLVFGDDPEPEGTWTSVARVRLVTSLNASPLITEVEAGHAQS